MGWIRDITASFVALGVVGVASAAAANHLVESNPPSPPTPAELDFNRDRLEDAYDRIMAFQPAVAPSSAEAWILLIEGQQRRYERAELWFDRWSDVVEEAGAADVPEAAVHGAYRDAFAELLLVQERYLGGVTSCVEAAPPGTDVRACTDRIAAFAAGALVEAVPPWEAARAHVDALDVDGPSRLDLDEPYWAPPVVEEPVPEGGPPPAGEPAPGAESLALEEPPTVG